MGEEGGSGCLRLVLEQDHQEILRLHDVNCTRAEVSPVGRECEVAHMEHRLLLGLSPPGPDLLVAPSEDLPVPALGDLDLDAFRDHPHDITTQIATSATSNWAATATRLAGA